MFQLSPPLPSDAIEPSDANLARTQLRLRQLDRLIEVDMEYVESLHARRMQPAETADQQRDADAAALRLDRVGRAVRRNIALEARLADGSLVREMQLADDRAAAAAQRRTRVLERRNTVQVCMNEALETDTVCSPDRIDRLTDDVRDWMDREPEETFADDRPIGGILWRICRDLGLPVDLGVWDHEGWADDEMTQDTPGSPYAAWRGTRPPNPPSFGQLLWTQQPKAPRDDFRLPDNEPP
jgi:hypothetical protein